MRASSASSSNSRSTGSITSARTSGRSSVSTSTSSRCCALISTVSTRLAVVPSYAIVTWLLPSGRRYGITPALRTSASRLAKPVRHRDRQRHQLVGLAAGVPEHHPLVPGAERVELVDRSTLAVLERLVDAPCAISADCSWIDVTTPQVSPSIPKFASVYPISVTVRRRPWGSRCTRRSRSRRRP
jgi:hypothetical protein